MFVNTIIMDTMNITDTMDTMDTIGTMDKQEKNYYKLIVETTNRFWSL